MLISWSYPYYWRLISAGEGLVTPWRWWLLLWFDQCLYLLGVINTQPKAAARSSHPKRHPTQPQPFQLYWLVSSYHKEQMFLALTWTPIWSQTSGILSGWIPLLLPSLAVPQIKVVISGSLKPHLPSIECVVVTTVPMGPICTALTEAGYGSLL